MLHFDPIQESAIDEGGLRLYPADVLNHLLLVWSIDYVEHSPTRFTQPGQKSDVVIVDVIDLDQVDPQTNMPGLVARRSWWRQSKLIQALKDKCGSPNPKLAVMTKGPATKGQPPFILADMSGNGQATARANRWYQLNPSFTPSSQYNAPIPVQMAPETDLERMAKLASGLNATPVVGSRVATSSHGYPATPGFEDEIPF